MSFLAGDVEVKVLRTTSQTLTTSYAQLQESSALPENTAVKVKSSNKITLFLNYTANAGSTVPILYARVDFGLHGTSELTPPSTWYQNSIQDSYTGGDSTQVLVEYKVAGTAGTLINIPITVPTNAIWARVMVKETTSSGPAGIITGSVAYAQS